MTAKETVSSLPGEARIGPIIELPQLLTELGVSPSMVFQQAGILPTIFDNPESRLSYRSFGRMLMVCIEQTGRTDFGLLLGARFKLENFGELGELMRVSATVRDALQSLILNLRFYDRFAFSFLLQPLPERSFLGYSFEMPAVPSAPVFYDLITVITFRILREICGPGWNASVVHLSHSLPEDTTPYRRTFGPDVKFNQDISGVLFNSLWLDKKLPDADPKQWCQLNRSLQHNQSRLPLSFSEAVLTVLHQMLLTGKTEAGDIATLFGISKRTLRYRLESEGTSMQRLLADTRHKLACHLLQNTTIPISKIATDLDFAESATFSRAFRNWTGCSPSQWRKKQFEATE